MFVVGFSRQNGGFLKGVFRGDLWDVAVLRVLIEPVRGGVCMFSYHCGIILVSM